MISSHSAPAELSPSQANKKLRLDVYKGKVEKECAAELLEPKRRFNSTRLQEIAIKLVEESKKVVEASESEDTVLSRQGGGKKGGGGELT